MTGANLKQRLKEGAFILDGAMGTQLFARDIEVGTCNDYLNIESPDVVFDIQSSYIQAGSDAILTNTFGANKIALAKHNLAEKAKEINTAAAQIAGKAAGNEKYVLGDIGPCGDFLEPLGTLKPEQLKDAFVEQAEALLEASVDGFTIQTFSAIDEVKIAIEAVKSVCGDLPVFASMSFDEAGEDFKTMMGVDVQAAVNTMVSAGVDAVGFNCGSVSLDGYVKLAERYVAAVKASGKDVLIFAELNAGKPELVEGKAVYKVTPEEFAEAAAKIHKAGINIIGGCCGTGPEHIKALAENLKK